jgi:hypothetical protein
LISSPRSNAAFFTPPDPEILEWAARHDRLVVTADEETMIGFAYDRVQRELRMPGLLIIPQNVRMGAAVTELEMIAQCLLPGEYDNRFVFLPL